MQKKNFVSFLVNFLREVSHESESNDPCQWLAVRGGNGAFLLVGQFIRYQLTASQCLFWDYDELRPHLAQSCVLLGLYVSSVLGCSGKSVSMLVDLTPRALQAKRRPVHSWVWSFSFTVWRTHAKTQKNQVWEPWGGTTKNSSDLYKHPINSIQYILIDVGKI